jgi:hypothetical protein
MILGLYNSIESSRWAYSVDVGLKIAIEKILI